jgi:hypothetical protein
VWFPYIFSDSDVAGTVTAPRAGYRASSRGQKSPTEGLRLMCRASAPSSTLRLSRKSPNRPSQCQTQSSVPESGVGLGLRLGMRSGPGLRVAAAAAARAKAASLHDHLPPRPPAASPSRRLSFEPRIGHGLWPPPSPSPSQSPGGGPGQVPGARARSGPAAVSRRHPGARGPNEGPLSASGTVDDDFSGWPRRVRVL